MTETNRHDVASTIQAVLAASPTFYLSTTGADGPWCAGAFFAERGVEDLFLILESHGRSLRNVRHDPRVAGVVSSGNPFQPFLQFAAEVEVLEDKTECVGMLRAKSPQIEPLLGAPVHAVRLKVTQWKVTDIPNGWIPAKELRPAAHAA